MGRSKTRNRKTMSKPKLEKVTFEFSQEANCVSTNDGCEILTIDCESSLGIDNDQGCFYVLKTEGWAVDSVQDLQNLFDRIQKSINETYKGGEQ